MASYEAQTGDPSFDVYLNGFYRSAETFPRNSAFSVGLFGGDLLGEIESRRMSVADLASYPDRIEGSVHDSLYGSIVDKHREFDVPDFPELGQGGIRRGAGLTVSVFISSLTQLFLRPNGGEELPNIAKPGWEAADLEQLDTLFRDNPAAMQATQGLFELVKGVLESDDGQRAATLYRSGMGVKGRALGIAVVVSTYGAPEKYALFARASEELVGTVRPLVQETLLANAARLGITPQAAATFGHNITRTVPDEPWLPPRPVQP